MARVKYPTDFETYNEMVLRYHEESDRAAALLAGSFLEHFLEKYLRSFLIKNEKAIDHLFDGYGPFATFSSKIDCLYALGRIPVRVRDDLRITKKIRNHFAHCPEDVSFASSPVRQWCSQITMCGTVADRDMRTRYLMGVGVTCGILMTVISHKNGGNVSFESDASNPFGFIAKL